MLTGAAGQLGWELQARLSGLGHLTSFHRAELNIGDADAIRLVVRRLRPDLIVNAAGYTAVDQAETEPEMAMRVNGAGPGVLAEEAKRVGAALISYSSDYVFDGNSTQPYTEEDRPNPLSAYGRSKLAGDQSIASVDGSYLIFRTSWVYTERNRNFVLAVLKLAKERAELRIVNDQVGAPTPGSLIADYTSKIIAGAREQGSNCSVAEVLRERRGLYNLVCGGQVSRYEFAKEVLRLFLPQNPARVVPVPSSEFTKSARRPSFSVLSTQKLEHTFGLKPPPWQVTLERFAAGMRNHVAPVKEIPGPGA